MVKARNHSLICTEDVRHFILDRDAQDNPLLMDLAFSEDEIDRSIRYACMSFNEIPPYVFDVHPERIPFEACFLHGILYHLYLAKFSQLSRNDIDHQEGNMTVEVTKRLIANLKDLMQFHKTEFETAAKNRKITANVSAAFANF